MKSKELTSFLERVIELASVVDGDTSAPVLAYIRIRTGRKASAMAVAVSQIAIYDRAGSPRELEELLEEVSRKVDAVRVPGHRWRIEALDGESRRSPVEVLSGQWEIEDDEAEAEEDEPKGRSDALFSEARRLIGQMSTTNDRLLNALLIQTETASRQAGFLQGYEAGGGGRPDQSAAAMDRFARLVEPAMPGIVAALMQWSARQPAAAPPPTGAPPPGATAPEAAAGDEVEQAIATAESSAEQLLAAFRAGTMKPEQAARVLALIARLQAA